MKLDTLAAVKAAVDAGHIVKHASELYNIEYSPKTLKYYVVCSTNQFTTGLNEGDVEGCYIHQTMSSKDFSRYMRDWMNDNTND